MNMGQKILAVIGIVACAIAVILFMTVAMPVIIPLTQMALSPTSGNYAGFTEAVNTAPLWLYLIPVLIGGIAVIVVLRAPERGR